MPKINFLNNQFQLDPTNPNRQHFRLTPTNPEDKINLVHDGAIGDYRLRQVQLEEDEFTVYRPNETSESMLGATYRHIQELQTIWSDENGDITRMTREGIRSTYQIYQDIQAGTSSETLDSDGGVYRLIQNTQKNTFAEQVLTDDVFSTRIGELIEDETGEGKIIGSLVSQTRDTISQAIFKDGEAISSILLGEDGFFIDSKLTMITGDTYIENGVINTAHIGELDASVITTGQLRAAVVSAIQVNVSNLTGNVSDFIQSNWNAINSRISITGTQLSATHTDGSQTILNAQGLYHREGTTNYKTHYLADVYNITGIKNTGDVDTYNQIPGLTLGPYWYQLPSIYRGKTFSASVAVSDPYGYHTRSDYNRLAMSRYVGYVDTARYNIDYANARVPIIGYVTTINLETYQITGHPIQVQLTVTA